MFRIPTGLFVLSIVALALAAGCGKKNQGPTCEGAAEKILDVARGQLEKVDQDTRAMAESMLSSTVNDFVKQCKEKNWSEDAILCIASAADQKAIQACGEKHAEIRAWYPGQDAPAAEPAETPPADEAATDEGAAAGEGAAPEGDGEPDEAEAAGEAEATGEAGEAEGAEPAEAPATP